MRQLFLAIRTALYAPRHIAAFVVLFFLIFSLLFFLQVRLVPGNDLVFQASLMSARDWLFLALIALLNALFVVMQFRIFSLTRKNPRSSGGMFGGIALNGIGSSSGILASLFGVATCGLCISALFSFLGANSVLFLIDHRDIVFAGATLALMTSLFITARRFNAACEACRVPLPDDADAH